MKMHRTWATAALILLATACAKQTETPLPEDEIVATDPSAYCGRTTQLNPETALCDARVVDLPDAGTPDTNVSGLLGPVDLPADNVWGDTEIHALDLPVPVYVRTVIEGTDPVDLRAYFTGFIQMDGREYLFLETDPLDLRWSEWGGAAAGMSGSPIIIGGRIAGALSYHFGSRLSAPFAFGATPIKEMLKVGEEASRQMSPQCLHGLPVNGLLTVGGPAARILGPLMTRLPVADQTLFSNLGISGIGSAGVSNDPPKALVPGSSFSMNIISGPIAQAGIICTVSEIDGTKLYGCGHPVFGKGHVNIPFSGARVYAINSSPFGGAYKLAVSEGPNVGTIENDKTMAVEGRLGVTAVTISVISKVGKEDASPTTYPEHQVTPLTFLGEYYTPAADVAYAAVSPLLLSRSYDGAGSAKITLEVSFADTTKLATRVSLVSDSSSLISEAWYQTYLDLEGIFDMHTTVKAVTVTIAWSDTQKSFDIRSVALPPSAPPVIPGQSMTVAVSYVHNGVPPEVKSNEVLVVPADFSVGSAFLVVSRATQKTPDPLPDTLDGLIDLYNGKPPNSMLQLLLTSDIEPEDGTDRMEVRVQVDKGQAVIGRAYLDIEVGAAADTSDAGTDADAGSETDGGEAPDAGTP